MITNQIRKPVPIYLKATPELFTSEIYQKREPAILRGLDLGECTAKWTIEYLTSTLQDTTVKVHVSDKTRLDFVNKNFMYKTLPFHDFIQRASEHSHKDYFVSETEVYYLRSLGDDPRKEVADIMRQFPQLSGDIKLPPLFDPERFFSSVFRIGSKGMQLWTHYDVMDNMLIQVVGEKRVVLYSPCQADNMYLIGDKSAVLDIDEFDREKFALFAQAESHECILSPGDVLFIPALWFHNVTSLDFAVSINVFWKHLDDRYYDNRDTYGNRDLQQMSQCSQMLDKMIQKLNDLPDDYKDFYARVLSGRLRDRCLINKDNDT